MSNKYINLRVSINNDRVIRLSDNIYKDIAKQPLIIIKICILLTEIQGSFNKNTIDILSDTSELVNIFIDKESIRDDIMLALTYEYPSLFFSALHLIGALKYILPSMDRCFNHTHGTHHKENIGEHIMLTGDNLHPRDPILRLAGYLHDVGKPVAYINDGMVGSFKGHEKYGRDIVREELKHLCFSHNDIRRISNLVYMHMRQCRSLKKASARRLQRTFEKLGIDPHDYIRLKLADRTANVLNHPNIMSMIKPMLRNTGVFDKCEEEPFNTKSLALSGGEIIDIFKLQPGPLIGKVQNHLLDYVIHNGVNFNNKKALLSETALFLRGVK